MPAVSPFRVIAEGDDAVGGGLTLAEAVAAVEAARKLGKRHVSIVDATGQMIDLGDARRAIARAAR